MKVFKAGRRFDRGGRRRGVLGPVLLVLLVLVVFALAYVPLPIGGRSCWGATRESGRLLARTPS